MSRSHHGTVNTYHCTYCNVTWSDEWDCGCDDECPQCGRDFTPLESELVEACSHPDCYAARVAELESEGMTTSDAQGIADAEQDNPEVWRANICVGRPV